MRDGYRFARVGAWGRLILENINYVPNGGTTERGACPTGATGKERRKGLRRVRE